jgi:hypothetical protein
VDAGEYLKQALKENPEMHQAWVDLAGWQLTVHKVE